MGRSVERVKGKGQREEVQEAEYSAPERNSGPGTKATGRTVPSAQSGALPHRGST